MNDCGMNLGMNVFGAGLLWELVVFCGDEVRCACSNRLLEWSLGVCCVDVMHINKIYLAKLHQSI